MPRHSLKQNILLIVEAENEQTEAEVQTLLDPAAQAILKRNSGAECQYEFYTIRINKLNDEF